MKKVLATLALAGAIGVSGCASLNIPGTGGLDINQVLAAVDATLNTSCAVLNGALPTLQSIQAIIAAGIPGLVDANNAVTTGENIAKQICAAAKAATPSSSAMMAVRPNFGVHAPIFVDGVAVYFQ